MIKSPHPVAVLPNPAPLQTPEKAFGKENLTPRGLQSTSVSSLVSSQYPTGELKPPSGQRAKVAVLIQVIPAEPLTPRSPAGTSPVRTLLLGPVLRGGGGAEGQSNAPSPPSGDAAHKPAKRRSPNLWRSRSTVWLRRSWSGQTKSSGARKEEWARPRSATPQNLAPQTPDPWNRLRLQRRTF